MTIAIYTLLVCWVFWHGYIHAMGLYRARLKGRLVGLPLVLSIPVVLVTFILDVILQFTVASLVFWEKPTGVGFETRKVKGVTVPWPVGDWFVTDRLRRYIAQGEGWRFKVADVICYRLTDPFDPTGAHCDSDPPVLAEAPK
jgi:hypothetical protein